MAWTAQSVQTTVASGLEPMPWHHHSTQQHEPPTARALCLQGIAADLVVPVTRLHPHLCASPSSYFNAYHMAAHSFPTLHPLASSSSLPGSLMTANPVSSSIQPALQACSSINRLKFLASHLSQIISNFAPIALHRTAALSRSAFAISSHICCQANCLTCALQFEAQLSKAR